MTEKHAVIAFMGGAKNAMGQEDHAKGTRFIATRQPAIVTKKMRQLRKYSPEHWTRCTNLEWLTFEFTGCRRRPLQCRVMQQTEKDND